MNIRIWLEDVVTVQISRVSMTSQNRAIFEFDLFLPRYLTLTYKLLIQAK